MPRLPERGADMVMISLDDFCNDEGVFSDWVVTGERRKSHETKESSYFSDVRPLESVN